MQLPRPTHSAHPVPHPPPHPTEFADFVREAAVSLETQGWKIVQRSTDPDAVWHLIARKGHKYRVVQIVLPATGPAGRQNSRALLGEQVRLPSQLGTMEQWLAHVRPNGYVSFGPYVLNAQRWAGTDDDPLRRLGLQS